MIRKQYKGTQMYLLSLHWSPSPCRSRMTNIENSPSSCSKNSQKKLQSASLDLENNNHHVVSQINNPPRGGTCSNTKHPTCVPNTNEYIETEKNPLTDFFGVDEHHDTRHKMVG
eukprot:m.193099 g.193099  ORF g.193099 m.193099 type:complete len:114 (-) comp32493_c4_seq9:28-369(-)